VSATTTPGSSAQALSGVRSSDALDAGDEASELEPVGDLEPLLPWRGERRLRPPRERLLLFGFSGCGFSG
jgi:hypothetical protein